jgi:AraC-like DNA-binding protein
VIRQDPRADSNLSATSDRANPVAIRPIKLRTRLNVPGMRTPCARRSGASARQFQRRFTAQVGLTPKLYARTIRFDHALRAHRDDPARPWIDIVHETGYFDQAHFIRECGALVDLPPSRFPDDWRNTFFPARG